MKGLNKLALATAIAAAPFAANADLKALDDSAMGNVTGQAGVTIELETRVSIGEFTYTDDGTFAVSGIELGGSTASGLASASNAPTAGNLLDRLAIEIDVESDGDAVIHVASLDENNGQPVPIDWGVSVDSMSLRGTGGENTTLVSDMKAWGLLGALDIRVDTDDVAGYANTGTLQLDVAFDVRQMDFEVDFLAVGITGMEIRGAAADGDTIDFTVLNKADATDAAGVAQDARMRGLAAAGFAIARLDVYKGDSLYAATGQANPKTEVLRVDIDDVLMDVNIAQTRIGGTNIGTIGIDNLHISDTKLAVYGH
ncbi:MULTISPECIES: DUF6160 family protein [Marinobacter]|jgi:hypothetical protein|uniref:DUF6160 domain-containing protein n=1 Tax=Marinobacter salsuginis TaxID=418719 RepID=A0A5M3Q3D0_9GAMM|nr:MULTISPECIES: DUF6160 family protein [Marinobacter]MBO6812994.1 hypothetical protein [Marinobacter sp.]MBO6873130.1 hypothetical protein [Marinobacter sp.]GBO89738.1 hypothetical protein MSSD14B_34060 [Marinobacter salsuginis]|tara:strand:- start:57 stop:992 length:936 start_codon:yes stop_codon:yes gene_type:complete